MSEQPAPMREPATNTHTAEAVRPTLSFGHSVRPEILLPGAALSLGFALLLLQPRPLVHPVVCYGILLCMTTAMFLYGRKVSQLLTERSSASLSDILDAVAPLQPETDHDDAPAIDAAAFGALEKSLGLAKLLEILHSYLQNAEHLITTLDAMAEDEQWPEAVRIAQDIAGAASGFGLAALTAAARSFAQQARDGRESDDLRNAARLIVGEHQRVRAELAKLSSRLAA